MDLLFLKQVIHSIASSVFQIRNRNDHRKELKTEPVDNSIAILPLHGLRRRKVKLACTAYLSLSEFDQKLQYSLLKEAVWFNIHIT